METAPTAQRKPTSVGRRSFKLRSPSLNSVRLRRIFDIFDKNHDNIITIDELEQALGLLGLQAELSELKSMVQPYVEPGNQGLRYQDFEALHRSLDDVFFGLNDEVDGDDESDLSEAFKVFDEDGDGYISARELQIVLAKLGLQEGREIGSVEMMISSVDQNQDGRVDFFEFKDMMRSVSLNSYV
ncbi:Calcium-binding protein CAST [Sesamum alatum]|uniref:Calcium-binding protein CAST n=1 Tax=Sesamum alatum TaxID=300844 RepID=A0AAE2CE41_9LAMI|nr:Calcium-binding protein CAST [Sesamum alatum]